MVYADIASAVNGWVFTNSIRNQVVYFLLELVDLKQKTDGNNEIRQSQAEKDKYDLINIKSLLRSTLNPFNYTTSKYVLFNIKAGRKIRQSVKNYLLNVIKIDKEKIYFSEWMPKNPWKIWATFEESNHSQLCVWKFVKVQ